MKTSKGTEGNEPTISLLHLIISQSVSPTFKVLQKVSSTLSAFLKGSLNHNKRTWKGYQEPVGLISSTSPQILRHVCIQCPCN
jgi:hypothetical protein